MCIIIDSCAFSAVFEQKSANHIEFKPLLLWLTEGKGKIVYGGSKYRSELYKSRKYLRLFGQFKRAGKLVEVDCDTVDLYEEDIINAISDTSCNDPHLIAIVIVSKCRLICSIDTRSFKFLKKTKLYPKGVCKPKLYTKAKNSNLLTDKLIAPVCMPIVPGSKDLCCLFNQKIQPG